MAYVGWVNTTSDTLADLWPDAAALDPKTVELFLEAAYRQCLDFLPKHRHPDGTVPNTFVIAQVLQAKGLARASVNGTDELGADGVTITAFPMDWTVRNLLRPKRVGRVL